jgi:hypothetical protein
MYGQQNIKMSVNCSATVTYRLPQLSVLHVYILLLGCSISQEEKGVFATMPRRAIHPTQPPSKTADRRVVLAFE